MKYIPQHEDSITPPPPQHRRHRTCWRSSPARTAPAGPSASTERKTPLPPSAALAKPAGATLSPTAPASPQASALNHEKLLSIKPLLECFPYEYSYLVYSESSRLLLHDFFLSRRVRNLYLDLYAALRLRLRLTLGFGQVSFFLLRQLLRFLLLAYCPPGTVFVERCGVLALRHPPRLYERRRRRYA